MVDKYATEVAIRKFRYCFFRSGVIDFFDDSAEESAIFKLIIGYQSRLNNEKTEKTTRERKEKVKRNLREIEEIGLEPHCLFI